VQKTQKKPCFDGLKYRTKKCFFTREKKSFTPSKQHSIDLLRIIKPFFYNPDQHSFLKSNILLAQNFSSKSI